MEQTKTLPPLVGDEQIRDTFMYGSLIKDEEHGFMSGANYVRHEYEQDRQRTREVVQALVDKSHHSSKCEYLYDSDCDCGLSAAIALAKSRLQIEPTK